jgi:hypothetical protein
MTNKSLLILNPTSNTTARVYNILAALIIALGVALAFFTVLQKSSTVDESVHLASGYSYWATGDFRMNPEHPALVKEIAAIPLLFFHLNFDPTSRNFDEARLWDFGPEVIYHNVVTGPKLITAGRIPLLVFLVLLGILVYRWSKKLYGEKVALVILFLTMTCENILAHSGLITTDVPITFAFLFVCFTLAEFLTHKSKRSFAWFTLALTFVLLVKYSAVVIAVAILAIMAIHTLLHKKNAKGKVWLDLTLDFLKQKLWPLIAAGLLSLVFIFAAYSGGFKTVYSGTDTASAEVVHDFVDNQSPSVKKGLDWIGNNVPIPAFYYLEGMALVLTHNKGGHTTFFLGQVSNRGWWYYFPTVFLFKTSLTDLLLFVGVAALGISRAAFTIVRERKDRLKSLYKKLQGINFEYIVLVVAPLIFFTISMRSRLNLGVRYILPIYPFLFILSGLVIKYFVENKYLRAVLVVFLGVSLYGTITTFPNYLSYYNALAFGKGVTPLNISDDSNLDWGQDLPALKKYMDDNHIDSIYLRYFGTADLSSFGINSKGFPSLDDIKNGQTVTGYVVVSATAISSPEDQYSWPLLGKRVAIINDSLYVYYFDHLK